MANKGVLIVDDNTVVRSSLRRLFESYPEFEVSGEAENGQDAIDKAARLKPDLIILDLAMPVMNGLDAAPELRKMCTSSERISAFTQVNLGGMLEDRTLAPWGQGHS
jgi:DNA-binding NarL/FixJ family response regulator